MQFFFLLVFILAFDWYTFRSLKWFYKDTKGRWKYLLGILYWIITLSFIVFLIYKRITLDTTIQNSPLVFLNSFFLIFYVSKGILFGVSLIDDIRLILQRLFQSQTKEDSTAKLDRSLLFTRLGIIGSIIPFAILLYGKLRNPYRYKLYEREIPIKGLPDDLDGFKIVQISDIHTGSFFFDAPLARAVDLINQQKGDIIFFTGDLVNERTVEAYPFQEILSQLEAPLGVYSVLGNHDFGDYYAHWENDQLKKENLQAMVQLHDDLGWKLLRNTNTIMKVGESQLAVIGVDNQSAYEHFPSHGNLPKAYQGTKGVDFKILLSHDPTHWDLEINKQFKDINLTLSGHTHGSQFGIEIPGWIKWSPVSLIYEQWGGLYEKGGQYIYVNRGLGYIGYAGRVGILPEISVLKLIKQ